jgi:hypothetical protein
MHWLTVNSVSETGNLNQPQQDITWAKFSTIVVAACMPCTYYTAQQVHGCMDAMHLLCSIVKLPNLELEAWLKQLLGSLLTV